MSRLLNSLKYSFTHGSKAWFKHHINDQFVKKANQNNYRSRAVYKLEQIEQKYKVLGDKIIDLGCAPGSWSEYCQRYKNSKNQNSQKFKLVAVDILEMKQMQGIDFYKCDARDRNLHKMLLQKYGYFDSIISDMAPNFSGINFQTHDQIIELNKMCVKLCLELSHQKCNLVMKTTQGQKSKVFFEFLQILFQKAYRSKPKASRSQSKQLFFVCKHIKDQYLTYKNQPKSLQNTKTFMNTQNQIIQEDKNNKKIHVNDTQKKQKQKIRKFINNQLSQILHSQTKINKRQLKQLFDSVMKNS